MTKENNMTDCFDWINAKYYWEDDMYFMDMRDETDPCENPYDNDDDYPFEEDEDSHQSDEMYD